MALLKPWMDRCPLVAILRGITPSEAVDIGVALRDTGFSMIEVPMNSPDAFTSIALLAGRFGEAVMIGGGTVMDTTQVARIADAGGRLVVMPHAYPVVVEAAKKRGMVCLPGFATPTEAFAMIAAGADGIKLFPAEANPPPVLKAMRAVLPRQMPVLPFGGITPDNMAAYWQAGASGFGLGSALYRPGDDANTVTGKAMAFIAAINGLRQAESA